MKSSFNQRYHKIYALAEYQAKHFAEAVSESFDDLDGLSEFVDTMFYIHSITGDEQFAVFLGMMYEVIGCEMPETIDSHILTDQRPSIFFNCFLTSFLTAILNRVGGELPCPAM